MSYYEEKDIDDDDGDDQVSDTSRPGDYGNSNAIVYGNTVESTTTTSTTSDVLGSSSNVDELVKAEEGRNNDTINDGSRLPHPPGE
mmetsp:Transcript_14652/g.12186  ORF Transcript_14652/g.12186 Transcript_14652/m.12186 type:complete len:86 (+) Transcript_14652:141-398(+)